MTDKPTLRRDLRARRAAIAATPPRIAAPPELLARLAPGQTVAAYIPVGSEADPADLITAARTAGCRIVLPHVVSHAEPLRFLEWHADTPLAPGPFGLTQPPADAAELHPGLILTPLLGFDPARNRLGQGAGHYDRAFARYPDALRIGVAFAGQMVDALIPDPWDVPLHAIITEDGWR